MSLNTLCLAFVRKNNKKSSLKLKWDIFSLTRPKLGAAGNFFFNEWLFVLRCESLHKGEIWDKKLLTEVKRSEKS